jgi:Glycosyl hydrolase family 26
MNRQLRHQTPDDIVFGSDPTIFHAAGRKPRPDVRSNNRIKLTWIVAIVAAVIAAVAAVLVSLYGGSAGEPSADPGRPTAGVLHAPGAYIGVYARGAPQSYAGISAFTAATGVRPGVVVYYSGWKEPFQAQFARTVVAHHGVPLVQMEPGGINIAAIASGRYDTYLRSYASEVKAFGRRVILSFGHEMNGTWYSWGYRHTSPTVFVAAWRHIVSVFRAADARNVIWLWTINISECRCHIDSPAHWWPGNSYVNWVGIDGYYYRPSWKFAPLFGPTIKAVRALTLDPILISETAAPTATQLMKIPDLFAGIRAYGLLGFVWFDANKRQDWHISSPAAFAAFRRGAEMLERSAP